METPNIYHQRNHRNLFLFHQSQFWDKWNNLLKTRCESLDNEYINNIIMILIKKITTLLWKQYNLLDIYSYSSEINSIIKTEDGFKIYDNYINSIISQLLNKRFKYSELRDSDIVHLSTDIIYLVMSYLQYKYIHERYKQLMEFKGNELTTRMEYLSPEQCKEFIQLKINEMNIL